MIKILFYISVFCVGVAGGHYLCGIKEIRPEPGPILYENGIVDSLIYSPRYRIKELANSGDAYIVDDQREMYIIIFKCSFGKLYVEDKELWGTLSEKDKVSVGYREIFTIEYKNGQEISKKLHSRSFVSAHKRD